MTTFAQLDRARARHRAIAVRALLAIAVLAPTAILFVQLWGDDGRDLAQMTTERHGVAYIGAVQSAITAVVHAESTTVAGGAPNLQQVDRAALAVSAVDDQYGDQLRTHVIWANAQNSIQQLHTRAQQAPADAFSAFTDVSSLLLSLLDKVRVTSGLSSDPNAETVLLQDGAAARLPDAIVAAGQFADLMALAAANGGTGASAAQIADRRAVVARDATDLSADLDNASNAAPATAVSDVALAALDRFRLDVDALAGVASATAATSATGSAGAIGAVGGLTGDTAARAATAANAVQASAGALATAMLHTVDVSLSERINDEQRSRLVTAGVAALALVIACVPLLLVAIRRRAADEFVDAPPRPQDRTAPTPRTEARPSERSAVPPAPVADGTRALGPPAGATVAGRERFAEGAPLPRRRQPIMPPAAPGRPSEGRELLPAGVVHHRRTSSATDGGAAVTGDGAPAADDWGRTGVPR